ncbi:hypothetical protein CGJ34_08290 [Vibrio parahaemolyticus]|uniref:hypothetical protein n=1 Tax=Vibrio parahaemolyticus TaxID=670 RepID=UPI001122391D|nr:hypothetical protein [Vibrio parahaemolyticus]TOE84735.1 hypothetical protein CGJ34_08290 [Vibrio parahaemolyticus]
MEVIQANLPLNTFAERDDFEAEIDAITDSTDGETEEPCRDDDKVNRLVERQRLVKEVARAQTFGRHQQKKRISLQLPRKLESTKPLRCQADAGERHNPSSVYNLAFIQTLMSGMVDVDAVAKETSPIATTGVKPLMERMQTWRIEVQQATSYLPVMQHFTLSARLFHQDQKLKSYRVLHQGKYYLFEFEGEEMKEYCEVDHDRA